MLPSLTAQAAMGGGQVDERIQVLELAGAHGRQQTLHGAFSW
jgi:hypothetical protein